MLANSRLMLKLRVYVFGISTLHHVVMVAYLLTLDFTTSKDPRLWYQNYNRFNLITGWFNILLALHYPISGYCDWRALRNESYLPHVKTLNKNRDFGFISLLFPSVMLADTLFWRIWLYDRELFCPATIDDVLPRWVLQHNMHTFSLVVNILELVLVPRERPQNFTLHRKVAFTFICFYLLVCFLNYISGVYVYTLIRVLSNFQLLLVSIGIVIENMFWCEAQWHITEWVWRRLDNKVL